MTLKPDQIVRNGFTESLGSDWVAVTPAGTPIGRATTKEALERSCPDAEYFTGADLEGSTSAPSIAEAALGSTAAAFAAVVAQGVGLDSELVLDRVKVLDQAMAGLEPEPVVAEVEAPPAEPEAVDIEAPVVAKEAQSRPDPLDHDLDGRRGGSKPGIESTAHKGVHNRQRKPRGE